MHAAPARAAGDGGAGAPSSDCLNGSTRRSTIERAALKTSACNDRKVPEDLNLVNYLL